MMVKLIKEARALCGVDESRLHCSLPDDGLKLAGRPQKPFALPRNKFRPSPALAPVLCWNNTVANCARAKPQRAIIIVSYFAPQTPSAFYRAPAGRPHLSEVVACGRRDHKRTAEPLAETQ